MLTEAPVKFVLSAAFNAPEHLAPLAEAAEACGFAAMAFPDHVVHPEKLDTPYPYTADGSRRWSAFTPWVDRGSRSARAPRSPRGCASRTTSSCSPCAIRSWPPRRSPRRPCSPRGRVMLTVGVGWSNIEYTLARPGLPHARPPHRRDDRDPAQAVDAARWSSTGARLRLPAPRDESGAAAARSRSGSAASPRPRCAAPRATTAGSPISRPARRSRRASSACVATAPSWGAQTSPST